MNFLQKELSQLITSCNKNFRPIFDYDGIYFIGDFSSSFALRASSIANRLENFKGVVVNSLPTQKRNRISTQLNNNKLWEFIHFDEFIKLSRNYLLVDFNDTAAGAQFRMYIATLGFDTVDYLKCMNDLSLVHTYLPVDQERQITIDNLDKFIAVIKELADPLSQETVIARLKTFICLDRNHFHQISQPFGLFSKDNRSKSALHIGNYEHYIDVGAAHGDTVAEFYNATNGNYGTINAFEPDRANYQSLKNLCKVLPNSNCYWAGLSNKTDMVDFYETPENRFGSRFDANSSKKLVANKVNVMKMDDVIEQATIVKIDVEGHERKVIEGAKSLIQKQRPSINIAGYHFPKDLFEIIDLVKETHSYKNVAVRHFGPMIYDTNILFSDAQPFS
jgi:FkbM family methyltransferase